MEYLGEGENPDIEQLMLGTSRMDKAPEGSCAGKAGATRIDKLFLLISILKDDWIATVSVWFHTSSYSKWGLTAVPSIRLRLPAYRSSFSRSRAVRFAARDTETTVYSVASPGFGYVQGNSVALLRELAADFFPFAQRNPKSRGVIGLSQSGSRSLAAHGEDFELVTGIPRHLA